MKLKEIRKKPPKVLLYGPPGTGKTALVLTLGKRLQVLDLDDGLETGRTLHDQFRERRMEVDVVQALETSRIRGTAFPEAKRHVFRVVEMIDKGTYPFEAFCIDSLTSLADGAVRYVLGNAGHVGRAPQIQEWGAAFIEIENILTLLRSLPIVVILTAHQHVFELDGETQTEIAVPGRKLPGKICSYFDEVWRMRVRPLPQKKFAYVLQTKSTAGTVARSRLNLEDGIDAGKLGLEEVLRRVGWEWREGNKKETGDETE